MKSLIIGMGIGQLYKSILTNLNYTVVTVDSDPNKSADFLTIEEAIKNNFFDTIHICTPNYTHEAIARMVAPISKIVFIEKPGVKNSEEWQSLVKDFPNTRFMMVKNNMWRNNISEIKEKANSASTVYIEWIRKNCIPSPGSWFTTSKLAFGGVSRDLMPHLLSLFVSLNDKWYNEPNTLKLSLQQWELADIDSTEYGQINPDGTYDVDDNCKLQFGDKWICTAVWRSLSLERSAITIVDANGNKEIFELGWCPEEAYLNMIKDAVQNLDNDNFWGKQFEIDMWIHKQIETL